MAGRRTPPALEDHGLELLLAYDGRVLLLEGGYSMRFVIRRTDVTTERPHGLSYAFTLHDQYHRRVLGFDNAHAVKALGRAGKRSATFDHWHRSGVDKGRPYMFTDAATLVQDFFNACERFLNAEGIVLQGTEDRSTAEGDGP